MATYGRLPGTGVVTRAGWQCPECRTVYSPDVTECRCVAAKPLSERIRPDGPVHLGGATIRILGPQCTCTPFGPGTVPCPVHQPVQSVRVTC